MSTMEFDEMKKIWNAQTNETLYAINEDALHRRIKSKKKAAGRIVNTAEIGLMIVNTITAIVLYADAIIDKEGFWDFAGATIMLLTVGFLAWIRKRRINAENKFDRSMLGELNHAIASAKATVKIATMLVWWYMLPVGIFSFGKMLYQGASIEKWLFMVGAFTLAFLLVNWENRKCHVPRVENLLSLKKKLVEEV